MEQRVKHQGKDDPCVWHEVMHDPKSTTRADAIKTPDHPLQKCYKCKKYYEHNNQCPGQYKGIRYIEKKAEQK